MIASHYDKPSYHYYIYYITTANIRMCLENNLKTDHYLHNMHAPISMMVVYVIVLL